MKDVPTQVPAGIQQASVLERASWKDLLVYRDSDDFVHDFEASAVVATSSIRRRAQWLRRYPLHEMVNLRGNINTRLAKVKDSDWHGAIFAAAGVDRIHLRPDNSIELDWMLPAPAQGAIMVVCRSGDDYSYEACRLFNNELTAICVKTERDFLRKLLGGCSTPIAAICEPEGNQLLFRGNILSVDGKKIATVEKTCPIAEAVDLGTAAGEEIIDNGGAEILSDITASHKTA
jgi:hydroxymethylbilane synthase